MNVPQVVPRLLHRLRQPDTLAVFARGAGIAFVIQGAGIGLKYLSQVFFARWLGPAEFGNYTYALSWAQLLAVLGGLGLATGALRFVPEYLVAQDWPRLRGVVRRGRQLTLLASVVLAAVGTGLVWLIRPERIDGASLAVGLWLTPLIALMTLQMEMTRGAQRIALALFPSLVLHLVLALGFSLPLALAGRLTGLTALGMFGLAALVTVIVQLWGLRRALPPAVLVRQPRYETNRWLQMSFPILLGAVFGISMNQADILITGSLLGPREAGIYAAASRTAALVSLMLLVVNTSAAPMFASLHARGDRAALQRLVSLAAHWLTWPALTFMVILIIWGEPILQLFGPEFVEGRWVLALLALGQLVNASAGSVGYLMSMTGHERLYAQVLGWSALLNIILSLVLTPLFGMIGAACATMTTLIMWNVWMAALVRRKLGINTLVVAW